MNWNIKPVWEAVKGAYQTAIGWPKTMCFVAGYATHFAVRLFV